MKSRKETGSGTPYRIVVVSRRGGPVTTTSGLPLVTSADRRARSANRTIDTLIVPGGHRHS